MSKLHFSFNKKWRRRDQIMFLERFELYVSSGLMIDKALEILGQGISSRQRQSVENIRLHAIAGFSLSKSFSSELGLSKTIIGLIEHGESSGGLVRTIQAARLLLEKEDELSKKCLSAMIYPVVIGIFALGMTIGLVRGVMPQIIPMLRGLHVELPLITRVVMSVSENMVSYGLYGIVLATVLFVAMVLGYKKSYAVRGFVQYLLVHIPLIGKLFYFYYLSLFLQSCGILIESGLRLEESFTNTTNSVSFIPIARLLKKEIRNIRRGIPLGTVLAHKSKNIPLYVSPLIRAGEASGTFGVSLMRASAILDKEIEHSLKRLTSLIEPVMMIGIGGVVGSIALSIMMPIYDISRALQH